MSIKKLGSTSLTRRQLLRSAAAAGVGISASGLLAACGGAAAPAGGGSASDAGADAGADNPLAGSNETNMQGKTVALTIGVIAGWPPSQIPIDLAPDFAAWAKEKFGYDVTISKSEAPFAALFQKVAPTLAAKSTEFNMFISDSQWLGALAEPGWIVKADDIYALNPEIDLEPYSDLVRNTYQIYPDGSDNRWGFPQMPDDQGVYLRLDMLEDPEEQAAFEAKYGKPLPTTYEEYENMTMDEFEEVVAHFHRPDEEFYGTAIMQSKEYDFFSCAWHPYAYSTGGAIWDPETQQIWDILNSDNNVKALEEFKRWQQYQGPGSADYGIGDMIDLFTQGKVFSAFQWLAVGLFMIPDELKGKVLAIPHPKFIGPDGNPNIIGAMGGQPWVVNAFNDDDQMRACVDLLKWWYTDETQAKFLERGGLPWSKAAVEAPGFEESTPYARAFKYMLSDGNSQDFWHHPKYAEMLAVQQEAFNGYATGQYTDAKAVLDFIAAKQQAILFDAGTTDIAPPEGYESMQPA